MPSQNNSINSTNNNISPILSTLAGSATYKTIRMSADWANGKVFNNHLNASSALISSKYDSKYLNTLCDEMIFENKSILTKNSNSLKISVCDVSSEESITKSAVYKKLLSEEQNKKILGLIRVKYLYKYLPVKSAIYLNTKINKKALNMAKDAYYETESNAVFVTNRDFIAVYHELGHAVNHNKNRYLATLRKYSNKAFIAAAVVCLLPQFSPNKNSTFKQNLKTEYNKTRDFIERYIISIGIGCALPALYDEAKASIIAGKFLNSKDKELSKAIIKSYKFAYLTYILHAVSLIAGVKAAIAVKNRINSR